MELISNGFNKWTTAASLGLGSDEALGRNPLVAVSVRQAAHHLWLRRLPVHFPAVEGVNQCDDSESTPSSCSSGKHVAQVQPARPAACLTEDSNPGILPGTNVGR
jgi:hypothetical protein